MIRFLLCAALVPAAATAQNFVPEGDFEQAGSTWTQHSFNDPLGTTGFAAFATVDQAPSQAVFADFHTLTPVMSAAYRSQPFQIPVPTIPLGFSAAWEKQVTTPIPSPSVNRVELRILDSSLTLVQSFRLQAPNQTGLVERANFTTMLNVTPGTYTVEVFMRHSNLAGIPFKNWVDDVYIGDVAVSFYGQGCAGTGGFVPKLHTNGTPRIGNAGFAFELAEANAPGIALCTLGFSNTSWGGGPSLPFQLGGGCAVLSDPVASAGQPIIGNGPGNGTATLPIAIPNDTGLIGRSLYSQWIVPDQAAPNQYGLVLSAGMRLQIQM